MNSKTGIGVVFVAMGVFVIAGSITGNLSPMLASLFYPPAVAGTGGSQDNTIAGSRSAASSSQSWVSVLEQTAINPVGNAQNLGKKILSLFGAK